METINEQGNITGSLPNRRFSPCYAELIQDYPDEPTNWLVCQDTGNVSCAATDNPDFGFEDENPVQTQLQLQNDFYEAVGSPSPGDLISWPDLNNWNDTGVYCLRYMGTDTIEGAGALAGSMFAANLNTNNLGNVSCNACLNIPHSCSPCEGCVEDPNGAFNSLSECQASGCSEDLESFANSIGIASGVSGMTAAEQYCVKCSTNSYPPPMDEKCGCCPQDPEGMPMDLKNRMQKLAGIPKVIMNPTADQVGISQAEFDKKVSQLKDAERKLNEGKLPLNEKLNLKCRGCGGSKFGLCAGRGCLSPWGTKGIKLTVNF